MGSIGYHTVPQLHHSLSHEELDTIFTASEPFHSWDCAFCERHHQACSCASIETTSGVTPRTKAAFQALVKAEQHEAVKLKSASNSYLRAILHHVPLGLDFNTDQQRKIARAGEQLDRLHDRFRDLWQATHLVAGDFPDESSDEQHAKIPEGLVLACDRARALLANCFGNIRECHVCPTVPGVAHQR